MKVRIIGESGFVQALFGIGLSYGITSGVDYSDFTVATMEGLKCTALKLVERGGSHAKFMESIAVWLDITAPRYWWQQFDTYRVGVTKQSESTMHTILTEKLGPVHFSGSGISLHTYQRLNRLIKNKNFEQVKRELPESFLQRRIVCTNYKALAHIYNQRKRHKLVEWRVFTEELGRLTHPEYIRLYGTRKGECENGKQQH